jgi:hypothetical protein
VYAAGVQQGGEEEWNFLYARYRDSERVSVRASALCSLQPTR